MRRVEILRAEEDTIDWEILDWADARDLWDEHYDKTKYFSVVADILSKCSSVFSALNLIRFIRPYPWTCAVLCRSSDHILCSKGDEP